MIVAPRQSNHATGKYRLRYRRAATIIISPRPSKWPSWSSPRSHPDCRATQASIAGKAANSQCSRPRRGFAVRRGRASSKPCCDSSARSANATLRPDCVGKPARPSSGFRPPPPPIVRLQLDKSRRRHKRPQHPMTRRPRSQPRAQNAPVSMRTEQLRGTSPSIERLVAIDWLFPAPGGRDAGFDASGRQRLPEPSCCHSPCRRSGLRPAAKRRA